ncbi:MAG: SIMPL domain-containing protein [Bacillota bacterium]
MMKKIMVLSLLVLSLFLFSACGSQQIYQGTSETPAISVQGTGKIIAEPDTVEIRVTISSEGTDSKVQEQNAAKTQKVIDALIKLGLDKKEIETEYVNFYPLRHWTEKEGEIIKGYRAENTIKVKTTKLDKVGQIIDTAVAEGAQQVGNLAFDLSDQAKEEMMDKAIEAAIKDARKQADAAAKAAGVSISGVKKIQVVKNTGGAPIYLEARAADMKEKAETPIMPKDAEYVLMVQAEFLIK